MNSTLAGRRILITGGSAGIGLATARHLLEGGARVHIAGRDGARLGAALSSLEGAGGTVCDVCDLAGCARLVDDAVAAMQGLNAVVHSAGVGTIASITEMSGDAFRAMIDVNLIGAFNICKAALPRLATAGRGDVVLIGSRAGRYAFAGGTGYCAAKAGLQGFAEALFLDVSRMGVGVSLVAPGTVATGFAGVASEPWHLRPEDVASAIGHCLSGDRGANLNWIELRPSRRDG